MLSIVIPTLNAADELAQTLEHLKSADVAGEFIVDDGCSFDATPGIAAESGVKCT
ncbi:MAG: glycosyltransferase, partial [Proteobacteria bacterium]|nr:glycosyltransferase [Pseudomonadota bacterium]